MLAGRVVIFAGKISKGFALKAVVMIGSAVGASLFGTGFLVGKKIKRGKKWKKKKQ